MTLALTDVTDGTVVSATTYNANNTAIENAINSLDGADISAGSVPNTALANDSYEFTMQFNISATGAGYVVFPMPDLSSDGPYTIEQCSVVTVATGSVSGDVSFVLESGTIASKAWSTTTTHVTGTVVTNGLASGELAFLETTVSDATLPADADNRLVRFRITTGQTNAGTAYATVKFKRELRS